LKDDEYIKLISSFKGLPLAIIHYPEETMKYFVPALGVPNEVVTWCYNSNIGRQSRLINFYNIKPDFRKVKQPYKNPTDKRIAQRIADGHTGARMYDWFSDIQLVKNVSKGKDNHPCPVPIELMKRIILLCTNEGDIVCDPFMGRGTTAKACIETNRKYVGFELSAEYCMIANKEIKEYAKKI
jgi:DNA modification methylase